LLALDIIEEDKKPDIKSEDTKITPDQHIKDEDTLEQKPSIKAEPASEDSETTPNRKVKGEDIPEQNPGVKVEPAEAPTSTETPDIPNRSPSEDLPPWPSSSSNISSLSFDDEDDEEDLGSPFLLSNMSFLSSDDGDDDEDPDWAALSSNIITLSDDEDDDENPGRATLTSQVITLSDDEDEQDDVKFISATFRSPTKQHLDSSARPAMSSALGKVTGTSSQRTLAPEKSSPRKVHSKSLLSLGHEVDDDEDVPPQLLSFLNRRNGTEAGHHSAIKSEDHDDNGSAGHGAPGGKLLGPGHATSSRHGNKGVHRGFGALSERPRKQTLSDVMREEEQLDAEEAAATAAKQRRELKREEIEAAKRRLIQKETQ
jgi:hypothetical protein